MNIYRQKYGIVKNELYAFGRKIGVNKSGIHKQEFWEDKFSSLRNDKTWEYVITAYLAFWCSEEERKYIVSMFFRRENVINICSQLHLSERSVYIWRDQILTDLIGLAVQSGLMKIDIANKETIRSEIKIIEISEDQIGKIIEILGYKAGKVSELKRVLRAIYWIEQSGSTWKDLPAEFGSWRVVYNIYNKWNRNGHLEKIKEVLKDY